MTTTTTIDHSSFTVPSLASLPQVVQYLKSLGIDLTPRLRGGLHGYREALHAWGDSIILNFNGHGSHPEEMGVHVTVSGQGWRYLEHLGHNSKELFTQILALGARFTRVDVARDTPDISMDLIQKAFELETVKGDFRDSSLRMVWDKKSGGRTFYFGSRSSESFARVYDKAAQAGLTEALTRFEYEFKRGKAHAVALLVADGDWEKVIGACHKVLQFCEPSQDSNKSRWKECSWFKEFIEFRRFKLAVNKLIKEVMIRKTNFMTKNVATNLLMYREAGYLDEFLSSLDRHMHRLKDSHREFIEGARVLSMSPA